MTALEGGRVPGAGPGGSQEGECPTRVGRPQLHGSGQAPTLEDPVRPALAEGLGCRLLCKAPFDPGGLLGARHSCKHFSGFSGNATEQTGEEAASEVEPQAQAEQCRARPATDGVGTSISGPWEWPCLRAAFVGPRGGWVCACTHVCPCACAHVHGGGGTTGASVPAAGRAQPP